MGDDVTAIIGVFTAIVLLTILSIVVKNGSASTMTLSALFQNYDKLLSAGSH